MRRGIIVGGMVIGLLMGCNNEGESALAENGLSEIGRSVENTFYSFLSLIADTLGFRVTKDTTRQAVGQHFTALGTKLGEASAELEKIAEKAITGIDKGDVSKNPVRIAVDTAKEILGELKRYLDSLKDMGDTTNKVVNVISNQTGASANEDALKIVYKALKGIVETAKKVGEVKEPITSNVTLADASIGGASVKDGAKVLTAGAVAGGAAGPGAAAIVSAVSGEEILAAIIKSVEGDATGTISGNANGSTSALKFARGHSTAGNLAQDAALAGAVSGGIALRSLVKEGKLASHSGNDEKAVQSAGITSVNKLLGAVEDIVKKTVKKVLEKVKVVIDTERTPKVAGQ